MGSQRGSDAVKPLLDAPPQSRERGVPRLFILAVVLVAGITAGWLFAARGVPVTTDSEQAMPDTPAVASLPADHVGAAAVTIEWREATAVPPVPPGWELHDHSDVAEALGTTHMIIQLRSPTSSEVVSEIWSSDDGLTWGSRSLDLDTAIADPRLAATDGGLLLIGSTAHGDALWRADALGSGDLSWSRIPLRVPNGLRNQVLSAAVADDGDVVVSLVGEWDLWREVLPPFLPEGLSLDDEVLVYSGDEFLRRADGTVELRLFAEPPEVLIVDDTAWVRMITPRGDEIMKAVSLPRGCRACSESPQLTDVQVFAVWASSRDGSLMPVEGDDVLPSGCFRPAAWGDGFVAAPRQNERSAGAAALWTSETGGEWVPDPIQPPDSCSPVSLAVSGDTIHLTAADGTQCCRGADLTWLVRDEPRGSCYLTAGGAGILAYPVDFRYDRALLSCDGLHWSEIQIPGTQPYPMLAVLDDGLLALAVHDDPDSSSQIRIWRGTPGSA